jgi:hypothetical protein
MYTPCIGCEGCLEMAPPRTRYRTPAGLPPLHGSTPAVTWRRLTQPLPSLQARKPLAVRRLPRASAALFGALEVADLLTTALILSAGGREIFPVMAYVLARVGVVGWVVGKLALAVVGICAVDALYRLLPGHVWLPRLLTIALLGWLWLVIAFNLHWLLLGMLT